MYQTPDNNDEEFEVIQEAEAEAEVGEVDEDGAEVHAQQKLKKVKAQLKEAEAAKMNALEEMQRVKADFLNSKRRLEEQALRDKERSIDGFIESLLPLCDSFAMAMEHKAAWEALDPVWRKGMEGVYQQLQQLLHEYDTTAIEPLGELFDPNRHEALSTEDSDQAPETITKVIQAGYERNGTIIRPAKVMISN